MSPQPNDGLYRPYFNKPRCHGDCWPASASCRTLSQSQSERERAKERKNKTNQPVMSVNRVVARRGKDRQVLLSSRYTRPLILPIA